MTKIYEQNDKAFNRVSAFVILKDDYQIGTLNIKYPQDGAGRLYVYFHLFGDEMQRGWASGCGYDKRGAALENILRDYKNKDNENYKIINDAIMNSQGHYFDAVLHHIHADKYKGIKLYKAI